MTELDAQTLRQSSEAWDAFVEASAVGSHLQLTAWATVKRANGWRAVRVVADGGSGPIGAIVLVHRLGPGPFSMGYAPRGPIATTWDRASLDAFTAALRRTARRLRLTHVTVDPGLEDAAAAELLRAAGWKPSDPVQPPRSLLIDLAPTEAQLWSDLRSTTRRWVNRARRDGCTVEEGTDADFDAFYAIMVETAERGGFIHRTAETYREVLDTFGPGGHASLLLGRLPDGTLAAVKMLLRSGGRVTQPYSGMTEAGAESRANYLLEWETIRRAKLAGDTLYDMWGMSTPGIAYFKSGFGGREVAYIGAYDLVTLPFLRDGIRLARRAWVTLARRRRGLGPLPDPMAPTSQLAMSSPDGKPHQPEQAPDQTPHSTPDASAPAHAAPPVESPPAPPGDSIEASSAPAEPVAAAPAAD